MILVGLEGQIKQTKTPKSTSKLEEMYFVFWCQKSVLLKKTSRLEMAVKLAS